MKKPLLLVLCYLLGVALRPCQAQTTCAPISGLAAQLAFDETQGTTAQEATGQLSPATLTSGAGGGWLPSGGHDGAGALALVGTDRLTIPLSVKYIASP